MSPAPGFERASFTDVSDAQQLTLLNRQLAYAAGNSPYYREALRNIGTLTDLRAVQRLPFLTAADLTAQGTALCCIPASKMERIVSQRSSGTAGAAKRLYFSANDLLRTVDFFREGMQWLAAAGDRVGIFLPGTAPDGLCDLLSRGLRAFGAMPVCYGEIADAAATAALIVRDRPDVLIGLPWQVRALSLACPHLRPKAVLLSADYVPEALRADLSARWACPVTVHYGMTECGYGFAVQHPQSDGMYYRRSDFLAEVVSPVSGAPVPCGQTGELVFTTLRREAMPLIRYRTGDRAVMADEKKIVRIPGRLGIADDFYDLQERLAPLPWLVDYAVDSGTLTAHVTASAPPDCDQRLSALSGQQNVLCSRSPAMLRSGKRT